MYFFFFEEKIKYVFVVGYIIAQINEKGLKHYSLPADLH